MMNNARDEVHSHVQHQAVDTVFDGIAYFTLKQRSRFWFGRIYLGFDILATAFIAMFSEGSLNNFVFIQTAGLAGIIALGMLLTLGTLIVSDTVINDLMPAKYRFPWARHNRWMMFMAVAITFALFVYANIEVHYVTALLMRYLVISVGAVFLAAFDLMERGEETVNRLRRQTDSAE